MVKKIDLTFSGAGFMGCYYFGVVSCWNKYIPRERVYRVAGASAGSLSAAFYLLDLPLADCLREVITMSEVIRSRIGGVFNRESQVVDVLPEVLDRLFPDDAHKIVSGRLFVAMTRRRDFKKFIVSHFDSKKDLIDALNCSCFIPVWSGNHCSTYKGEKYIDGGFTDNLPVFDEHTVRVCCFAGPTEISPYDRSKSQLLSGKVNNMPIYFTGSNFARGRRALFPPPVDYILKLIECGFRDTKQFILSSDLIKCDMCYAHLGPFKPKTISPSITPGLSRSPSMRSIQKPYPGLLPDQNTPGGLTKQQLESGVKKLNAFKDKQKSEIRASQGKSRKRTKFFSIFSSNSQQKQQQQQQQQQQKQEIRDQEQASPEIDNSCEERDKFDPKNDIVIITSDYDAENDPGLQTIRADEGDINDNNNNNNEGDKNKSMTVDLNERLVLPGSFKLAPSSFPPSPCLNRHCGECLRLRHEARNDTIEKDLQDEIQSFMPPNKSSDNLGSKLLAPFKWFRQLGTKSSYNLIRV